MLCGALASGNVLAGRGGGVPGSRIRRGWVPEVPALKIGPVIGGQILSASRSGCGSGHFGGPAKIIRYIDFDDVMPTKVSPAPPISTIAQGMAATLRLMAAPVTETGTGRYFNGLEEPRANDQAYDPQARRQLRELSEQLTGV